MFSFCHGFILLFEVLAVNKDILHIKFYYSKYKAQKIMHKV